MDGENTPQGMSRRDLLKKGGLVLGAAAWMTPAMQVLNMTPAGADDDGFDPQCESPMDEELSSPSSKPKEEPTGTNADESTSLDRNGPDIPEPPAPTD